MTNNILDAQTTNICQRGYNLLQMAIAMLVIGIILGTALQSYNLYLKREAVRITDDNLKLAITELQKFKQINGRYPCPASLTDNRASITYGLPTNCDITAPNTVPVDSGAWGSGIGIQAGMRDVDPGPANDTPSVRYGALPFKVLNLDEKQAYDGYGSKYFYVLTERMANQETLDERQGAIGIYDQDGKNVLGNSSGGAAGESNIDSGVFAVFSPGVDRKGGYGNTGTISNPCVAGDLDSQNCTFGATARYVSARKVFSKTAPTPQYYDDTVGFFSELPDNPWAISQANPDNISDASPTGVGIATNNPVTELDIRNSWSNDSDLTRKLPQGTVRASEKVLTDTICPSSSAGMENAKDCFSIINIAGDASENPGTPDNPGNGMKCPDGEFMSGIKNGAPICVKGSVGCNGKNQQLVGFNNGQPVCTFKPCAGKEVQECGQTQTLPNTPADKSVTIAFGSGKTVTYMCRQDGSDISWQTISQTGDCSCVPQPPKVETNVPCGWGFTGNFQRITNYTCPDGRAVENTSDWSRQCPQTCLTMPDERKYYNCPQYQGNGQIVETRRWVCNNGQWGGWQTVSIDRSQCVCQRQADKKIKLSDCPTDGYTGAGSWQMQTFNMGTCTYQAAGPIETDCKCKSDETRLVYEDPNCADYEAVQEQTELIQKRDGPNCSWGSKVQKKAGVCKMKDIRWRHDSYGSGSVRSEQMGPLVGDSCTPADFAKNNPTTCSSRSGSGFLIQACRCKP